MQIIHEIRKYKDDYRVWHSAYENMSFLAHWHTEIELVFVRSGSAKITVDGTEHKMEKGDVLVIGSQSLHFNDSYNMPNTLEFILFDPTLLFSESTAWHQNAYISEKTMRSHGIYEKVIDLFNLIPEELSQRKMYYQKIVTALLMQFWYSVEREIPLTHENTEMALGMRQMKKAIEYIGTHLCDPITLNDVAKYVQFSPTYFSALFHRYVGIGFLDYIQIVRIDKAIHKLQNESCTVIDAAFDSGFSNIRSFNRVFRKITGQSPTELLKSEAEVHMPITHAYSFGEDYPVEDKSLVVIGNVKPLA